MDKVALVIGGKMSTQKIYENVLIYDMVTFKDAVKIAVELEKEKAVDIFISPAGTAFEIQKYVSMPIVKTDISDLDILETLIYAESDSKIVGKRIALLMHESKEFVIKRLQSYLKNTLYFYKYKDEEDLEYIINRLIQQKVELIVGGPTCAEILENFGSKGYVLRLSDESIQSSINKAIESLHISHKYKEQNQRLKTSISMFTDGVIIVNNKGIITDCNEKAREIFDISEEKIVGINIQEITNDNSIQSVYKSGVKQNDKLFKYGDINLFTNRFPIIVDGTIEGAVITYQETNKIEKLNQKFRKFQTKGFIAKYYFKDIMGISESIKETVKIAKAFAGVDSDVLIKGETGTGKEIFAQSMHNLSSRSKGPFVAINCAALPENLLESELMGYEEGAFTGAKKGGKPGLFELADKGTIFLDEINQLPIQLQGRILRVLQERQVLRLGGDKVIPINVRIIAATNENLGKLIDEGLFRKDLYYRISVLNLNIPPLRKRKGDITLLINYYQNMFSNIYGKTSSFDEESLNMLENHVWNGNIRELINFIERYVVISKQLSITPKNYVTDYLDAETNNNNNIEDFNQIKIKLGTLKDMEKQMIESILDRYSSNKKQAALALGISRTTLWKKYRDE